MLTALVVILLASSTAILQVAFFSHLPYPFSALSFPAVAVAYGIVRERPLLSVGWALVAGALLDLHGLLGFGAEMSALFAAFFGARYLFRRVLTNAGAGAIFLLGASTAVIRWFALAAIDGARVLFGAVPILVGISFSAALAPLRQGLVAGLALALVIALEDSARARFRRAFLSHAASPPSFS